MNCIAHLKRTISTLEHVAKAAIRRGDTQYAVEALDLRFKYEKRMEAIVNRVLIKKNKS